MEKRYSTFNGVGTLKFSQNKPDKPTYKLKKKEENGVLISTAESLNAWLEMDDGNKIYLNFFESYKPNRVYKFKKDKKAADFTVVPFNSASSPEILKDAPGYMKLTLKVQEEGVEDYIYETLSMAHMSRALINLRQKLEGRKIYVSGNVNFNAYEKDGKRIVNCKYEPAKIYTEADDKDSYFDMVSNVHIKSSSLQDMSFEEILNQSGSLKKVPFELLVPIIGKNQATGKWDDIKIVPMDSVIDLRLLNLEDPQAAVNYELIRSLYTKDHESNDLEDGVFYKVAVACEPYNRGGFENLKEKDLTSQEKLMIQLGHTTIEQISKARQTKGATENVLIAKFISGSVVVEEIKPEEIYGSAASQQVTSLAQVTQSGQTAIPEAMPVGAPPMGQPPVGNASAPVAPPVQSGVPDVPGVPGIPG